jgi:alpha-L-rhamnosidase
VTSPPRSLPADWLGAWISPVESADVGEDRPAYVLERRFSLDCAAKRGSLFATALGVYEVFLNGERVGDHELAPGATNYGVTVYAQAHDVGSLLRSGENVLQVLLSDGWYRGRNGSEQKQDCWGGTTAMLVQLEVTTVDGADVRVVSDDAWTSREPEIVAADLMRGQTTDFSRRPAAAVQVARRRSAGGSR